ncbi:MAG: outer membrane beta-barrel protein [Acidobacteria bacterium]|nr:outer membrane beta-barrel protein [Acidobacteriota bacterium]MXX86983.1 outer membrane beta-barrel protein [Acidobacteriota bacterium]MYG74659.1 outer membrane beta-barrel protein [Acidobacteriota bacterium]
MRFPSAPVRRLKIGARLAAALLFAGAPVALAEEERSGFYLRGDFGANRAAGVVLLGKSNDRASRCDEFINPRYAELSGCTDPDRGSAAGWQTAFDPAYGALAGLAVGHRVSDWFRMEVETFYRESEYDQTSPVGSATGDTAGKLEGEIVRAEDRIGSVSSRNVFLNLVFDLPVDGALKPFAGLGVGVSWTELDYGDLWVRNADPAKIATAAGLPNEEEVRRNLAATTTSKQGELSDRLTAFQALAGVDWEVNDNASLGLQARYVRSDPFEDETEWERLRSHASQLRLDGSEPVTFRIRTEESVAYTALSVFLKLRF